MVLDFVCASDTVAMALAAVARGGHIVACGLIGSEFTLPLPSIVQRGSLGAIPISRRSLDSINTAFDDLWHGRVSGRVVLAP